MSKVRTRTSRLVLTSLALVGVVGLAACGGGGSDAGVASAGGSSSGSGADRGSADGSGAPTEEEALEFAQCMRKNGVEDFPDPEVDADGRVTFGAGPGQSGNGDDGAPSFDPNDEDFQKAQEACGDLRPGGGDFAPSAEQQAATQDAALEFAQCMRKQGFDVPDPDFSDDSDGPPRLLPDGLDPSDEDVRAAMDECREAFTDVFGDEGPGGQGGPGGPPGSVGSGGSSSDDGGDAN